jgi:hypothetical protein
MGEFAALVGDIRGHPSHPDPGHPQGQVILLLWSVNSLFWNTYKLNQMNAYDLRQIRR